jgi:hypothetical protein
MTALRDIDGKSVPLQLPPNLDEMKKDELKELLVKMAEDWQMLNAIHNARARDHGWCSDYEGRQHNYNTRLKVLVLQGRNHGPKTDSGFSGHRCGL